MMTVIYAEQVQVATPSFHFSSPSTCIYTTCPAKNFPPGPQGSPGSSPCRVIVTAIKFSFRELVADSFKYQNVFTF